MRHPTPRSSTLGLGLALALGCQADVEVGSAGLSAGEDVTGDTGADASATSTGASATATISGTSQDGTGTDGVKYDVGSAESGDTGITPGSCTVEDGDLDAVPPCGFEAPPESFDPEVQWAWDGDGEYIYSIVAPLVANLTDDNGDGSVDLCDTPDVVVSVFRQEGCCAPTEAYLYALDGATGALHWKSDRPVGPTGMTPAIADLDEDGLVEILAVQPGGNLVAFDTTGATKWVAAEYSGPSTASVAVANLDAAGAPEIFVGTYVTDADGNRLVGNPGVQSGGSYDATTAADLDDDGDLEIISCYGAMHHDGTAMWTLAQGYGYPQVADFDDDGLPEVLCMNASRIIMLEHDGEIAYQLEPGGVWSFPAVVHDLDGDGSADFASGMNGSAYVAHRADGTEIWTAPVDDGSGIAGGTAFDFLGDGVAEAMYGDHWYFYVFDGMSGNVELQVDRTSGTLIEYPVVADVDNDGSAEAVVVTNYNVEPGNFEDLIKTAPTVQVVRDAEDRWVPARRIWNQHTYHVTNVREDGTIPVVEPQHWKSFNTFRTQSQVEPGGAACKPEPAG